MGLQKVPGDKRYKNNSARVANRKALRAEIAKVMKAWRRDELLVALEEVGDRKSVV